MVFRAFSIKDDLFTGFTVYECSFYDAREVGMSDDQFLSRNGLIAELSLSYYEITISLKIRRL